MKRITFACLFSFIVSFLFAQTSAPLQTPKFFDVKSLKATSVKNQAMTGTCWCFATTSLVESEEIRKENKEVNLSEMFTVRNMYIEKARNYILRNGKAQFGEGGLGHDEIRAIATYGAMPLSDYTGLLNGQENYDHQKLFSTLRSYLDSILRKKPISNNWMDGYVKILNENLGVPPKDFSYDGKTYTPQAFAKDVLHFNAEDYVNLTSFTHQPYYQSFVLQVPDNYASGSFYNLPLNEFIQAVKDAIDKGYTVAWDADVSNRGFMQSQGLALNLDNSSAHPSDHADPDMQEGSYDASVRQQLYENLTTQDDHLMHITGVEKSKDGKTFFIVKNSWGKVGPYDGYIHVSEAYFAINTISIVISKAALSKTIIEKLKL